MRLVLAAFFVLAIGAAPARAELFPKECGTYRVLGLLKKAPFRIVLWEGTDSEMPLALPADCRKCPYLEGLPVEAELKLGQPRTVSSLVKIRPVSPSSDMRNVNAARLLEKSACAVTK